jgi:hypothetical protein
MISYTSASSVVTANPKAAGLARKKEGFGCTPEDDVLFALGFPFVRWLSTSHPDDANVEGAVKDAVEKAYPTYGMEWPVKIAARLLRKWGVARSAVASTSTEPLTKDEAKLFAARFVRGGAGGAYDQHEDAVLLLEAFVGADAALEDLVGGLETITADDWKNTSYLLQSVVVPMGAMMDRVPTARAKAYEERLSALLKKRRKSHPELGGTKALDVLLGGAEGFARSGNRLGTGEYIARFAAMVTDDPQVVREVVLAETKPQSARHIARLAYLGGADEVLDGYASSWRSLKGGEEHRRLIETVGRIRSPRTLDLMLDMSTASKAKTAVVDWFVRHAADARPFLEKAKGEQKVAADAILKKLPKN